MKTLTFRGPLLILLLWSLLVVQLIRKPASFAFGWDSFGYWSYLPAAFIHDDPLVRDMHWVEDAWQHNEASGTLYQITTLPDGTRVIRYPIGLALTWSPWFALGHLAAKLGGYPADGFSEPYQWAVRAGVMFLFLMGLLLLRKVLARLYSESVALLTVVLLLLGTNLLEHALSGQTMPHLTLFALYSAILFLTMRWRESGAMRHAIPLAVVMGLVTLIRPTEVVCVLLPLFWPDGKAGPVWRRVFSERKQWSAIAVIMLLMGCIQFGYWKAVTGKWFIDPYANPAEGLDLTSPHVLPFLLSFRKGWLVYTPIMWLAFAGLWSMARSHRKELPAVLLFCGVHLYLTSSWTCWWYADSFGSRAMVGTYPVWAIPIAHLLMRLSGMRARVRYAIGGVAIMLVALNLFQHWQYYAGIIHPSRMTAAAYKTVWSTTSRPPQLDDLLLVERSSTGADAMHAGRYHAVRRLGLEEDRLVAPDEGFSDTAPRHVINATNPFTPAVRHSFEELTGHDHAFLEVHWLIRPLDTIPGNVVVCTFDHGGNYGYRTMDIASAGPLVVGEWHRVTTWYMTPEVRSSKDSFLTYLWSMNGGEAEVIGPAIIVHERKPEL